MEYIHLFYNYFINGLQLLLSTDVYRYAIILGLLISLILWKGFIKTFQRQPVIAILCLIFFLPAYIGWAFCELFTKPINEE